MQISTGAWSGARCASGMYVLAVFDVVQHGVAVAERAALAVLTGEAHAHALGRERRERERFARRPVERLLAARHLAALLEQPSELRDGP